MHARHTRYRGRGRRRPVLSTQTTVPHLYTFQFNATRAWRYYVVYLVQDIHCTAHHAVRVHAKHGGGIYYQCMEMVKCQRRRRRSF